MTDELLIAETINEPWCWKRCANECHLDEQQGQYDDGTYGRWTEEVWIENGSCPTCNGTGKVPDIGEAKFLKLIQWARGQDWWMGWKFSHEPWTWRYLFEGLFAKYCNGLRPRSFWKQFIEYLASAIRQQGENPSSKLEGIRMKLETEIPEDRT